ncbi:MAG: DUF4079 domain-containing protein [Microcystaceae cyanobacterium]
MTWTLFIHPTLMTAVLALSIYALYLGIQVRRTRTAQGELKKALLAGKFSLRHYQMGSLFLALVVPGALGGMAFTYLNYGKLFLGSHLLVGLSLAGLIAVSASLAPLMQKGQDWARYTHVSLNAIILVLSSWQVVTGFQGLQDIISQL